MPTIPFALDRTDQWTLRAAPAGGKDTGAEYRVYVAWPEEAPPPGGFPLVILLDGDASFATLVETLRRTCQRTESTNVAPAVLVGVGYPDACQYDLDRRTFDYTFGPPAHPVKAGAQRSGGGDAFLDFLERTLIPRVASAFPIDPRRRALFGHSLGGLFVINAVLRRPSLVRTWLSVSPSLWWDKGAVLRAVEALPRAPATDGPPPVLLVTVGEYEEAVAPWQTPRPGPGSPLARRLSRDMVGNARKVADRIAAAGDYVSVHFECLAQEDHASALTVSIGRGLRIATGTNFFPVYGQRE